MDIFFLVLIETFQMNTLKGDSNPDDYYVLYERS